MTLARRLLPTAFYRWLATIAVIVATVLGASPTAAVGIPATTTLGYDHDQAEEAAGALLTLMPVAEQGTTSRPDAPVTPRGVGYDSGTNLVRVSARPGGYRLAPRALPAADVAVIGKVDDLAGYTLRPGERTLLNQLPNQGSPRLNYLQNNRVLRTEIGRGVPIRDVSVDPVTGALRNNTGFLTAERNILTNRDWAFDPKSGYWYPPGW